MCYGTDFTTPGNIAPAASLIKEAITAGETFRAHSFELAAATTSTILDQAASSMDEWSGRPDEQRDHGRNGQSLPL